MKRFALALLGLLLAAPAYATIVSSEIVSDSPQADGRRWVTERHVDHVGAVHVVTYMAEAATNVQTIMAARVPALEAGAKQAELRANLANALSDDTPAPTTNYSTNAEFSALLRETFRHSKGRDALRLGWYVESFDLTNAQLRNLFGIQAGQEAALNAKLDAMAAAYESMIAQAGE